MVAVKHASPDSSHSVQLKSQEDLRFAHPVVRHVQVRNFGSNKAAAREGPNISRPFAGNVPVMSSCEDVHEFRGRGYKTLLHHSTLRQPQI